MSRQAMVTSKSSAADLATLVLRDYSVATKLLRHVNSALYRRFGGTVSTISQAIVVLGFDQVRTTAMSLTLFGKTRSSVKAAELVSTSVASLVCGEIARKVAHSAGLRDTEEAFIAAMFRHLGKHLVLFYLPELHDRMLAHMTQYSMTEEAAARRVLGLSYEKLGMG
ncbi:MAG: HDOD domain-containing protein, partial [Myxococcales bacterium]